MRVVCLDVVIGIEVYRATAVKGWRRALWVAMVFRLTLDARLIALANQRLAAALADWFFVERLFGLPENESHE